MVCVVFWVIKKFFFVRGRKYTEKRTLNKPLSCSYPTCYTKKTSSYDGIVLNKYKCVLSGGFKQSLVQPQSFKYGCVKSLVRPY